MVRILYATKILFAFLNISEIKIDLVKNVLFLSSSQILLQNVKLRKKGKYG